MNLQVSRPKLKLEGGEVVLDSLGQLTGILIDSPMSLVRNSIPTPSREFSIQALKDAEKICLENGLNHSK